MNVPLFLIHKLFSYFEENMNIYSWSSYSVFSLTNLLFCLSKLQFITSLFLCLCFACPAKEHNATYQPPDQPWHQRVSPFLAILKQNLFLCFSILILKLTDSRCNFTTLLSCGVHWHFVLKCHISDLDSCWEKLSFFVRLWWVCSLNFSESSFRLETLCSAFRGEWK